MNPTDQTDCAAVVRGPAQNPAPCRRALRADEEDSGWPCDCGQTTTPPYCDGFSHAK